MCNDCKREGKEIEREGKSKRIESTDVSHSNPLNDGTDKAFRNTKIGD